MKKIFTLRAILWGIIAYLIGQPMLSAGIPELIDGLQRVQELQMQLLGALKGLSAVPTPEEKVLEIKLPAREYQFLYEHSFLGNLFGTEGKMAAFLAKIEAEAKIPREKVVAQSKVIGVGVFGEEIIKVCKAYLEEHKDADPNKVAEVYFVPLCKELINAAIGDVRREKFQAKHKKTVFPTKKAKDHAENKVLVDLTADDIFKDLSGDEKTLVSEQLKFVKDTPDYHPLDEALVFGFTGAIEEAVKRTMALLKTWYDDETKPKIPTVVEDPIDKARAILGITKEDRKAPEVPAKKAGKGSLQVVLKDVVLIPRLTKLIEKARAATNQTDVDKFTIIKKYIESEAYLIDGLSLERIRDKLDAVILEKV